LQFRALFSFGSGEGKSTQPWGGKRANQNPTSSDMNDDDFIDLIAPPHALEASSGPFATKKYDLLPNRSTQSRGHLLVQEMPHLIHEICLCIAIAVLLLIGGTAVLIGTKAVEGFELMFGER
jgi:hypothetical protein